MGAEAKINMNDVVLGGQWYKYSSRDGWGVLTLNIVSIGDWVLTTRKNGETSLVQIADMPDQPFISKFGDYEGAEVIVSVPGKRIERKDLEETGVGSFDNENVYSAAKWGSESAWAPESARPAARVSIFWGFVCLFVFFIILAI